MPEDENCVFCNKLITKNDFYYGSCPDIHFFCCRLAYSSMQQHESARDCYKKALELEPGNEGFARNLTIAETALSSAAQPAASNPFAGLCALSKKNFLFIYKISFISYFLFISFYHFHSFFLFIFQFFSFHFFSSFNFFFSSFIHFSFQSNFFFSFSYLCALSQFFSFHLATCVR